MEVIFSIGSNIGNRKENIYNAIYLLSKCSINVIKTSSFYETEPYGNIKQNWFLNVVIIANSQFLPDNLLLICKTIEFDLGRRLSSHWGERVIDIDILMYDSLILNTPQLTIPHKYLHLRNFVLIPLKEIAPNVIHPILNKTISQLLIECPDNSIVIK
jgi:2-amino-4-hydroxy-6-hydroxymethyldihydropteridine diphosphokinase